MCNRLFSKIAIALGNRLLIIKSSKSKTEFLKFYKRGFSSIKEFAVNKTQFLKGFSFLLCLLLFCTCEDSELQLWSSTGKRDASFFRDRRNKNPEDKTKVLNQSREIYSGAKLCSTDSACVETCNSIFSLDFDREDCLQFPVPQVYRFERIYNNILEQELSSLKKIDAFDLKVFLNLSPEPFLKPLQTLGPVSAKVFLNWIADDWQVAEVFHKEDFDFFFLEIFLNEIQASPISSLKEEVIEGNTFVDLAWLKQNDFALLWLDDYFKKAQCSGLEEEKTEDCTLAQYCSLSESLKSDVLTEIVEFENLKELLDKKQSQSYTDLKDFCFTFCSSEKGQNYCE